MLLAIDIGNSNIVIGGYQEETLRFTARFGTDTAKTETEYAVLLKNVLELHGISPDEISGGIISSVVPPLSGKLKQAVLLVKKVRIMVVGPGIKTGLNIKIDNPAQLGADLLATAIGTIEKYPVPAIIVDLGTATKMTVIDRDGSFRGGAIMPGVMIALDALSNQTAQLPHISLENGRIEPIGTNTVDCMKSGTILGTAAMIDGMIARYQQILGGDATVVACGGLTNAIIPYCTAEIIQDEALLLDGLRILYRKNLREK